MTMNEVMEEVYNRLPIYYRTKVGRRLLKEIRNLMLEVIKEAICDGRRVKFIDFGVFKLKIRRYPTQGFGWDKPMWGAQIMFSPARSFKKQLREAIGRGGKVKEMIDGEVRLQAGRKRSKGEDGSGDGKVSTLRLPDFG